MIEGEIELKTPEQKKKVYDLFQGKPEYFDIDKFCDVVEMLVFSDETLFAEKMIKHGLPSYYRDPKNKTSRILELQEVISKNIMTTVDYANDPDEYNDWYMNNYNKPLSTRIDSEFCRHRAQLIIDLITRLNKINITPHILEMGPADFWLPIGLRNKGLKFHYKTRTLNKIALDKMKHNLQDIWKDDVSPDDCQIFICMEVIEHLFDLDDIYREYRKLVDYKNLECEFLFFSTPLNTLCGGEDSLERPLGHLRTFNMSEFHKEITGRFKGYLWQHHEAQNQVLSGIHPQAKRSIEDLEKSQ